MASSKECRKITIVNRTGRGKKAIFRRGNSVEDVKYLMRMKWLKTLKNKGKWDFSLDKKGANRYNNI